MLALSVSISTSGSPRLTSPPSSTSHFRTVPSSIESDRRGIVTSVANSVLLEISERRYRCLHDVLLVWERRLLQGLGIRHRHVGSGHALDGSVERVEGLLLDQGCQIGADAAVRPALLDDHGAVGLLDGLEDGVEVEG